MDIARIDDAIASRVLEWQDAAGARRHVRVRLGRVQAFPDSSDMYAPFQITGVGSERVKYAAGVDEFQAISLAVKMIDVDLESLVSEGRLTWLGSTDLGFR